MLVLSRKAGQSLVISGGIVVTLLEVDGDRVKVGIEAPREVSVLRGELHAETRDENVAASTAGARSEQLLLSLLQTQTDQP